MINRRKLLNLVVAAVGAGLLPGAVRPVAASELGAMLSHPEILAALGEQCAVFMAPDQQTLTAIAGIAKESNDPAITLAAFAAQRDRDFRSGRVRAVSGWIMAEAECALCVLVARG